ncbi:FmdB family zinc ribbon protein [Ideonella sp. YS5]|uniref:FmdB family zinc ribbon protein n=1 Tax=Ideonella sp. YS5 TaxID=3453714 RepID=UPI003EEBB21A
MPIYAYRCAACGHSRDVLQKLSDAPLTSCPACGAEEFAKQITAAGFQLKGSGWYATDFRNNNGGAKAPAAATGDGAGANSGSAASAPASGGDSGAASASASPAAGGACGGSCACH